MNDTAGRNFFSTSAALQDFLLQEAGPGVLVVAPHQRLARQLWQRQRRAELEAGHPAWEPLPLKTLQAWLRDIFSALWPEVALAPHLLRLSLWRQALQAAPSLPGAAADLPWAQALDETYAVLCRHSLLKVGRASPVGQASLSAIHGADSPLIIWREQVNTIFSRLLAEGGWLTPAELPAYLLARLNEGKVALPDRLLVAGLESPAPAENAFLLAVARRTRVEHLLVRGDPQAVQQAVVLPDRGQEVAWVAAQLLDAAARGVPPHRLAVTAMDLEHYTPQLPRALAELLGPAQSAAGWAYNFSQGPRLKETPLFLAATLPLRFITNGERREDLVSLLLSPFYGGLSRHREQTAPWDRIWRERRLDQGWPLFRQLITRYAGAAETRDILARLDRLWASCQTPAAVPEWRRRLERFWRDLEFSPAAEAEKGQWARLDALLRELAAAVGPEPLTAADFLAWLQHGADQVLLPGPGVQEAGLQVAGLLEMRGLDFSRVFCLGMNSGAFPPPPRSLPLLTAGERRAVLGGTYRSQHQFSRELYDTLLGAAPELVLTRPQVADDEARVGSPLYPGPWEPREMAVLSKPNPAWLRSPAVRAALEGGGAAFPGYGDGPLFPKIPSEISASKVTAALSCPCRFLLEIILKLKELPEIEAGLDPRERGDRLHKVLAKFTADFSEFLEEHGWDQDRAQEVLATAAQQVLGELLNDLHWRAELERWLGETDPGRSLLLEWLRLEQERYRQGWRWRLMEAKFAGLREEGWPFALRGRLDRLDYHPESREAIVFDYKSGEVPTAGQVFDDLQEFQLPCYLLAVEHGLTGAPRERQGLKAGYIGLKSTREKHLKHEDFEKRALEWPRVAAALVARLKELGRRLAAGDFRPNPTPAPEGKDLGACKHCPYNLLCGFTSAAVPEDEEEGAD
jgi:ATP-dependent helicase/nuclease subunit B